MTAMTKEFARSIAAGDRLRPVSLWNRTERKYRHLPGVVEVRATRPERNCQTGTMVLVLDVSGVSHWLDAGWFIPEKVL